MSSLSTTSCFTTRRLLAVAVTFPVFAASPAWAEVESTGYVSPNPLFATAQDDLRVGSSYDNPGTLDITNGSIFASQHGYLKGNGTYVRVSEAGSEWRLFSDLNLSGNGSPHLLIEDGGTVSNIDGEVYGASSSSAFVIIDGAGSIWNNAGDLIVRGTSNTNTDTAPFVSIINGGTVNVGNFLEVGSGPGLLGYIHFDNGTLNTHWGLAQNDALRGTGTLNADHWLLTGDYTIASAMDLPSVMVFNEQPGQGITLNLDWSTPLNALEVFGIDDGTLTLNNGFTTTSQIGLVGFSAGDSESIVTVEGAGTQWSIGGRLNVGGQNVGVLNITQGGRVVHQGQDAIFDTAITLGNERGAHGTLVVEGHGSRLDAMTGIQIGNLSFGYPQGRGDMSVLNGGAVQATHISVEIGTLTVAGAGSTLDLSGRLDVHRLFTEFYDPAPAAIFEDGAVVTVEDFTLTGYNDQAAVALVFGAGTSLEVVDRLLVGDDNGAGTLRVEAGAILLANTATVGDDIYSDPASRIFVTGAGSMMTVTDDLDLGRRGNGVLTISDGGSVWVGGNVYINSVGGTHEGSYVLLDQGTLTVVGSRSFLNAENVMGVGTVNANSWLIEGTHLIDDFSDLPSQFSVSQHEGQDFTVNAAWVRQSGHDFGVFGVNDGDTTLASGIDLSSVHGYLGYSEATDATLTLTGAGTRWFTEYLDIGIGGEAELRVENGAAFETNHSVEVGFAAGSHGTATVSGAGSTWTGSEMRLGYFGAGTFQVEAGATATAGRFYLGRDNGSSGEILVTGAGSVLTTYMIHLGQEYSTATGTLRVLDGGRLDAYSIHAEYSDAPHAIQIDGAGSMLTLVNAVEANRFESDWLSITGGGTLISADEHRLAGGITIDGNGSGWQLDGDLLLGTGRASTLDVTGGASLTTAHASVGQNHHGESNAQADVLIDGAGSRWTVNGNLNLGGTTSDNIPEPGVYRGTLTLANGGAMDITGALFVDPGPSGSYIDFNNGTLNTGSALVLAEHLRGTGTINADYWLISGDFTLSDFDALPTQLVYNQLPDQNVTVNLEWSDPSKQFEFFGVDDGNVSFTSGLAISSDTGYVALSPNSEGAMTLGGAATSWQVAEDLYVGLQGQGSLHVENGAQLAAARFSIGASMGGLGLLEISGTGSSATARELFLGAGGAGTLRVTGGGAVTIDAGSVNGFVTLGEGEESDSDIEVIGEGSRLDVLGARWMTVGYRSDGTLRVEDGGAVTTALIRLSLQHGSTGSILVDAGTFSADDLRVGEYGNGLFELQGGGIANTSRVRLGMESQGSGMSERRSSGHARVDGVGTAWVIDDFISVGSEGDGSLEITGGAQVLSLDGFVSSDDGGTGRVTVSGAGSTWNNADNLTVFEQGELRIDSGGHVAIGGSLYLLDDSRLALQLGTNLSPALTVGQDAELHGALSLEIAPGTELSLQDTHVLMAINGTRIGLFHESPEASTLVTYEGIDLLLTYEAGDGNDIGLTAALSGDVDGDHLVGAADLDILLANWGDAVSPFDRAAGDLSGDGLVGQADLQIVTAYWGNNASNTGTVPEPMSAIPLLALLWINRRRRPLGLLQPSANSSCG